MNFVGIGLSSDFDVEPLGSPRSSMGELCFIVATIRNLNDGVYFSRQSVSSSVSFGLASCRPALFRQIIIKNVTIGKSRSTPARARIAKAVESEHEHCLCYIAQSYEHTISRDPIRLIDRNLSRRNNSHRQWGSSARFLLVSSELFHRASEKLP